MADLNGAAEIEDRVLERKRDGRAVHGAAARGRHGFEAGRDHQRVPAVLTYGRTITLLRGREGRLRALYGTMRELNSTVD